MSYTRKEIILIALAVAAFFVGVFVTLALIDRAETHSSPSQTPYSLPGSLQASTGASVSPSKPPPRLGPAWSATSTPTARQSPVSRSSSRPTTRSTRIDWDAVAMCESSGHWNHHSATLGLYWGGLQMNMTFWKDWGGLRFAARPDLATKAEQIAVAERAVPARGLHPWPYCGRFG